MIESSTAKPIRILIVDDHNLVSEGFKALLASEPGMQVVGDVSRSQDAARAVSLLSPDVVLMDFNMPGSNGLDVTRDLLPVYPKLKILIVSMYNEQRYIADFKKAGAKGYLLKNADRDELVRAIRTVAEDVPYFPKITSDTQKASNHSQDNFLKKLKITKREQEVISKVTQGLNNQQIADATGISLHTVETHRRNAYFKLEVKNTAELIRLMRANSESSDLP